VNGFTPFFEQCSKPDFFITVDLIRQQHLDAARNSISDSNILQDLERDIDRDCDWLKNFLLAAKVCPYSFLLVFPI
jgi:aspartate kinase